MDVKGVAAIRSGVSCVKSVAAVIVAMVVKG